MSDRIISKVIGRRVRELRKSLKLTQKELADSIGVSATRIGSIERGERIPILATLSLIADRLGVTMDYILADSSLDPDSKIMDQISNIMEGQPMVRKQLAVNILIDLFGYFHKEGGSRNSTDTSAWNMNAIEYNDKEYRYTVDDPTLVDLSTVEKVICDHCNRSIIGICPHKGNEPNNPEKVTCRTIRMLRNLHRYDK